MRKLKLQVQITVDGFVGGPGGEMDWMAWNWDDKLKSYVGALTDSVDTILLGRNMTDGFVSYWSSIKDPADPQYIFARKMCDYPKVVFSKKLEQSTWENTRLASGDLEDEVNKVKTQPGRDIIVYGGASFVSSLVKEKLIDEFHLFVNPVIIGKGLSIFNHIDVRQDLTLKESIAFECGINLLKYETAGGKAQGR